MRVQLSPPPQKKLQKRIFINNNIRAEKVRVVNEKGEQVGILELQEAINMAKEKGFDLVKITDKVDPPVCKIMNYGKYLYSQEKKETKKKPGGETKGIRLSFNISSNDMKTRLLQCERFFKRGHRIRIEMRLRGREKALGDHAREKMENFLESLKERVPYKIEKELKRESRGFTIIISKL